MAAKENLKLNRKMRKLFVLIALVAIYSGAFAQKKKKDAAKDQPSVEQAPKELPAPFQGGIQTMTQFFKDSLEVTPAIIKAKATGLVILKFTADTKGNMSKIIVYYADDYLLTQPVIEALKRTNGKWVIPEHYEFYDFVIPFSINYIPSKSTMLISQRAMFNYYQNRKPIVSHDQVPLNTATLLPTIMVTYGQ
jgi:hypothetical protein